MKVSLIPPVTSTGERRYSDYLISGLTQEGINIDIIQSKYFSRPNLKILIGSALFNKILNNENSIIHNLDNLGPYLIRHKKIEAKTIITLHDIAPIIFPKIHPPVMNFDFKYLLPIMLDNCDYIITDSLYSKNDIMKYFGIKEDKIACIPLGVDQSIFHNKKDVGYLKDHYGIKNKYLLYVGGDNPRKNLYTLIKAYSKIYRDIEEDLILLGPINKKNMDLALESSITSDDLKKSLTKRIKIAGYVNYADLPHFYNCASLFVFPSLYEGFGFPPLEAMACGCPVLVSSNSSLCEIVEDAGEYIYNPLDPSEIAEKILKILSDRELQEKLRAKGNKQVNKFSWANTTRKTIDVYSKLADIN